MKKVSKTVSNPESVTKSLLRLFSPYSFIFLPNIYMRCEVIIKMTVQVWLLHL